MKHPSIGSVVTKELGPRNELPTYVSIPSARRREQSGFLGPQYNPFSAGDPNVEKYSVRDLELPMGVDWTQMESRYSLLRLVDSKISQWDTGNTFDSIDSYYESALGLMRSPLAKKAFDIAQEPETLREQYGHTGMGQGCLLARRLVEAGRPFRHRQARQLGPPLQHFRKPGERLPARVRPRLRYPARGSPGPRHARLNHRAGNRRVRPYARDQRLHRPRPLAQLFLR